MAKAILLDFAVKQAQQALIQMFDLRPSELGKIRMEAIGIPFPLSDGTIQFNFDVKVNQYPELLANATVYVTVELGSMHGEGVLLNLPDTSYVFSYYPDRVSDSRVDNTDYAARLRLAVQA